MSKSKSQVDLTKDEIEILMSCVSMRQNWIETGNPVLSANDLTEQKRTKEIKRLTTNQKEYIAQLEKLYYRLNAHENSFY